MNNVEYTADLTRPVDVVVSIVESTIAVAISGEVTSCTLHKSTSP